MVSDTVLNLLRWQFELIAALPMTVLVIVHLARRSVRPALPMISSAYGSGAVPGPASDRVSQVRRIRERRALRRRREARPHG
jgi:hypothetical protein